MFEVHQISTANPKGWNESDEFNFSGLNGLRWRMHSRPRLWRPPMDVYETENALVIRVEIAGMQDEGFNVIQKGRFISISGNRSDVMERRAFHQMEIPFGEFLIELEIPFNVDESRTIANYLQGFLTVTLPKTLPIQIQIKED